jgi:hypothetical protein
MLVTLGIMTGLRADEPKSDAVAVEAYIRWFHRNVKQSRTEKALEALPAVLKYSEQYNVDPLLVACIISFESSWRPRPGGLAEIGYMQIHPRWWPKGFDRETMEGQIGAGAWRLRAAFDKCPSVERALTHYASGSCTPRTETTKKKIRYRKNYYMRMVERFRNVQ